MESHRQNDQGSMDLVEWRLLYAQVRLDKGSIMVNLDLMLLVDHLYLDRDLLLLLHLLLHLSSDHQYI